MAIIYPIVAKFAKAYDLISNLIGYRASVIKFVDHLPISTDRKITVLDIGCGTGIYSEYILKKYKHSEVYAFDNNEKLLKRTRQKLRIYRDRVKVFAADASLPLPDMSEDKFDLIVTAGILEYLPLEQTAKNISKYLKKDGFLLSSPVRNTCWGKFVCLVYGCKPYTQVRNIEAFEKEGFILIKKVSLPSSTPASFKEALIFRKG